MEERLARRGLKPIQTNRDAEGRTSSSDDGQPLSPMARLFHEPGSNVYIIGIFGSKTKIYPEVAKTQLAEGVLKHPRFASLQVLDKEDGQIKWVPTKVNLDDHVVVADVDPNMESPGDQFVEDYIYDLTKTIHTVDRSKPMWDLHLLDVKTSDGCEGVFVYRVHHSIGDGMSIMSLLLACSRKVSDPEALPTIPPVKKSTSKFSLRAVLQLLWNTIVGTLLFVATALFLKDSKTPLKGDTGVEKNPRRVLIRAVSIDDVKFVKKAMNNTINDVVLGVTQAGLSRYLNRRYGEIKNEKGAIEGENYLPENIRLRAIFYMNIRPSPGIKALADMMEKGSQARWGNEIGYVLLPFNIGFQKDPLDYVRTAKVVIDRKKTSLEIICSCYITKTLIKVFGSKVAGFFNYKIFANTTLWFSNVPGTDDEIAFCGHELAYFAPTCYGQPNALMIHVISYSNKLLFAISAEDKTIPDPHQLCDDLEDSLKLIKSAVEAKQHIKGD